MSDFTKKHIEDFDKYERVRKSGRWNMFDPNACAESKLTQEEYVFVMQNYEALRALVEAA